MFSHDLWKRKYKSELDLSIDDTFARVAKAIAETPEEEQAFFDLMSSGRFLPGGRILAYAGTDAHEGTFMNCYTMQDPEDDLQDIMKCLAKSARTMQLGGGIGLNFSKLRPEGMEVRGTKSAASGPVSFMEMWNAMSRTISGVGQRKGAMIAVLNVDHPDILKFIEAKRQNSSDHPVLEKFNISVGITDAFMGALTRNNRSWTLKFRTEDGREKISHTDAKQIMKAIVESAYYSAEPGVLFLDTINRSNNLYYTGEKITACNPCITADTWIKTAEGYYQVKDLIGKQFTAVVDGLQWQSDNRGFFWTGLRKVYRLETDLASLEATGDHLIAKVNDDGSWEWVEVLRLKTGDKVRLQNHGEYSKMPFARVKNVIPIRKMPVFDVSIPGINAFDANGLYIHNCGELPMPPYGVCCLGSINLLAHVLYPFTEKAQVDEKLLTQTVQTAVRFLDSVIDTTPYPLKEQATVALKTRRIGLGFFGLGSAFAALGVKYGSDASLEVLRNIMSLIRNQAYLTSSKLAMEKGTFQLYEADSFLQAPFVKRLPENVKSAIKKNGIRNSQLLAVAPTGSISQLAGNCSSGIEPIFALSYERIVYGESVLVEDAAWRLYKELNPNGEKPDFFVEAHQLPWRKHMVIQEVCQEYVDGAISKTINLPSDISLDELEEVFVEAWKRGLKGCTIYREGSLEGEILRKQPRTSRKPKYSGRPYALDGVTYKVKLPQAKHAFYLTFTHDGKMPVELFINTNDPSVQEWTRAIGRLSSAVFRNVNDPTFLIEEFKGIYAPSGFWSSARKKYVPSLMAEFGEIMQDYFRKLGLVTDHNGENGGAHFGYCTACGQYGLVLEEGCERCVLCGYNKCA